MRKLLTTLLLATLPLAALAQNRPAITGVAFFRGYAADLPASEHFYSNDLGFTRVAGKDADGKQIDRYAVNPSQWLEIVPLPSPAPPSREAAIAFTTRDAKGLQKYFEAHAIPVVSKLHDGQFSVKDPEGNLVYFLQAGTGNRGLGPVSSRASSHRIIHVGIVVQSKDAEDKFWKDLLGFRPYWYGGRTPRTDYISMQVPDGDDWIEYMLNVASDAPLKTIGVMDHFALGVTSMPAAVAQLAKNGCTAPACSASRMGIDGKTQMNVPDPDLTRVEFMEFAPTGPVCCSPFTGKHPLEPESR